MKNRNFLPLFAVMVVIVMTSCEKVAPVVEEDSTKISIALKTGEVVNDTIYVEPNGVVYLEAVSNGPNIVSWSWVFADDGTANGASVTHQYSIQPPAVTSVQLVGTDAAGNVYKKTKPVKAVWTLDLQGGVIIVSNNFVSDNLFSIVMGFHKAGMKYGGDKYFYTGNVTTPVWETKIIADNDTNWLISGGVLIAPESGDIGKYVVVRLNLAPGKYEMGVGMLVNNQPIWGNFWGAFVINNTLIKFELKNNGTIIPGGTGGTPESLPGKTGDKFVRAEISGTNLLIYTNHGINISGLNPFLKTQTPVGTWRAPILEMAVSGYNTWGVASVPLDQFSPFSNMVIFRYGPNLSQPTVYNEEQKNSMFWDPYFRVLKIVCVQVKSANLLGETQTGWIITSGVNNTPAQ
jgi:hypothetical protein